MTAAEEARTLLIGNLTIHFQFSPSGGNPLPLICDDGPLVTRQWPGYWTAEP